MAFTIASNDGNDFTTNNNLVSLTGSAPIQVEFIEVNGTRYAITWTSTTAWSLAVPVGTGTNALALQAFDRYGRLLTNVTDTIKVVNNSAVPSPLGYVVINEIPEAIQPASSPRKLPTWLSATSSDLNHTPPRRPGASEHDS